MKKVLAAKRHQKLLENLETQIQQQPKEYASRGQLKITSKNLETLKEQSIGSIKQKCLAIERDIDSIRTIQS